MTIDAFAAACDIRCKHGQRRGQAVWNELQKQAPEWIERFRTGPFDCYYHTFSGAGRDLILEALTAGVLTAGAETQENPETPQETP